jgi:hypothetical protein
MSSKAIKATILGQKSLDKDNNKHVTFCANATIYFLLLLLSKQQQKAPDFFNHARKCFEKVAWVLVESSVTKNAILQRLTSSIIKGDYKGLKDFFQCDLVVKRTTRSSDKGHLQPPTMKNIPSQGFRHQSAKLWNNCVDVRNAKLTTLQLRTFPK